MIHIPLGRRNKMLALAIAVVLSLSACAKSASDSEVNGTIFEKPLAPLSLALTGPDGMPYRLAEDTDRAVTLIFFGYTNCPDICSAVLGSIASGLARLSAADRDQVDVLFVTTDPKRDTPTVMREYLAHFDREFIGLTGDLDTIARVGKSVGVYVDEGEQLPGGGYDPNAHSPHVVGLDPQDKVRVAWNDETSPAEFANDIEFFLGG